MKKHNARTDERKLAVKRETLRTLDAPVLARVHGGRPVTSINTDALVEPGYTARRTTDIPP